MAAAPNATTIGSAASDLDDGLIALRRRRPARPGRTGGRQHAAFPFNGEDFALFLRHRPGAMFYLGVANHAAGLNGLPHAVDFGADERAIGFGVRAMAGLLADRLRVLRRGGGRG
jgi:metal-dependent amidase/aminoacylase/carboxypeptidase family protein